MSSFCCSGTLCINTSKPASPTDVYFVVHKPRLVFVPNFRNRTIIKACPVLTGAVLCRLHVVPAPCLPGLIAFSTWLCRPQDHWYPPAFLTNRHLNTFWAGLVRGRPGGDPMYRREELTLGMAAHTHRSPPAPKCNTHSHTRMHACTECALDPLAAHPPLPFTSALQHPLRGGILHHAVCLCFRAQWHSHMRYGFGTGS